MKIDEICIKNFKSYQENGTNVKFSDVVGFVGPNSAGKSNILEAIDLFFHPAKLDRSAFHKEQISIPISIEVTFMDISTVDRLAAKIMLSNNKITLRRTYRWNPAKDQGEADKNLQIGAMWCYTGDEPMDPYGSCKAADIKKYLSSPKSEFFRKATGVTQAATQREFYHALEEFWINIDYDTWKKNFKWETMTDDATIAKRMQDAVNAIPLPEYIYLQIEHSVADEMSFKKGSRIDTLFSALLNLTEKEKDRQSVAADRLEKQIKKYFSQFYDKKLETMNQHLNQPAANWNFSNTYLRIECNPPALSDVLQPIWKLTADDGYLSEIDSKGNGMQRLAVLQLLQIYAEFIRKQAQNVGIILAIEEPELYLHPPYKRALYQLFRKLAGTLQIFYTTHDPIFIRLEYFDEVRIVRKNTKHQSSIRGVDWSLFEKSETWKGIFGRKRTEEARRQELQNKCHGEQNEGFFANKVIIVEGNTEIYALPIFLKKAGLDIDSNNIALIQASGVDAILAVRAIFLAFEIPVYVIFDGDKPKGNEYQQYLKISNIKSYKNFLTTFKQYASDQNEDLLQQLRTQAQKFSRVLPETFLAELEKEAPNVGFLQADIDSMIPVQKLDSIKKKANRNRRLQEQFGMGGATQEFMPTTIQRNFAVWEHNFEKSISEKVPEYAELHRQAKSIYGDSKPLIAKYIASKTDSSQWTRELNSMICTLKRDIEGLTYAEDMPIKQSRPAVTKKRSPIIRLMSYHSNNSVNVYSCAGGPINPLADDPIEYAEGDIPPQTDFIIKISGDSMEPDLPDGAYAPVKLLNGAAPPQNAFCVLCLDGNSICKQVANGRDGVVRLISRNKKYETIKVHCPEERLIFYGVIIEKNKRPCILQPE